MTLIYLNGSNSCGEIPHFAFASFGMTLFSFLGGNEAATFEYNEFSG
jgi:hypothetical protein